MRYYPLQMDLQNKRVVVVGGGEIATQKVKGLLLAKACVCVISPEIKSKELLQLHKNHKLSWMKRTYQKGDLRGAALAFGATSDKGLHRAIHQEASERGIWFNAVDHPRECDFTVPARVQRGELLITISTGGEAPFLAKALRKKLEKIFGEEYEQLLIRLARVRKFFLKKNRPKDLKTFLEQYWEKILEHCRKREKKS